MTGFLQESWFFTWELFKFTTLFYTVWVPGFLLAGFLACRYRHQAWSTVLGNPDLSLKGVSRAVGLGIVGSAGRKKSMDSMGNLLSQGVTPSLGLVFLIASRNMTIYFWAIFALSLGAEFATGQLLGALVMIGFVMLSLGWVKLQVSRVPTGEQPKSTALSDLPSFPSWQTLLFFLDGWLAIFKFIGQEIKRSAPSLALGIMLGGIILASGLQSWWPTFADVFGHATLLSDLTNSLFGGALSVAASLSPVGNLPVIHALFKTEGLGYPGIISFCLASAIHRSDIKTYLKTFGRRQGCVLVGLLYGGAVLGGLGSTWIYAVFGFRPDLPPVRLAGRLFRNILGVFGF
jgi:hypothetical protein